MSTARHLEAQEAELSVLGGVLLDNTALDRVSALVDTTDFFSPRHQIIYKAMLRLAEAQQPLDPVTLATTLEQSGELEAVGGMDYLFQLSAATASAVNVEHHSQIVHDYAFSLLGDLFGGGIGSAFAAADRLPWISGLAQLTGLIGLVALVSACRSVAVVAGDEALANDAARAGVWVGSVVAVSVVVQALAAVRDVPPGVLLLAGVVALITALGMLAVLLGLLRRTADVLG